MRRDRPFAGLLVMALFCLVAPVGDAAGKAATAHLAFIQIVAIRFAAQTALLMPITFWRPLPRTRAFWSVTLLRAGLNLVGLLCLYIGLSRLPLADATAIAYVMPFFAMLFGWLLLGETVGPHRIAACLVGFIGTILVLQPNLAEAGIYALAPLGVALVFTAYMLLTRVMSAQFDPLAMQAASGLWGVLLCAPLVWGMDWPPLPLWPTVGLVIFGTATPLLMTLALSLAPAATVAPVQFLEIPFAVIIGWLLWRDLPGALATAGIALTLAAGVYVIWREQANAAPPPAPEPSRLTPPGAE